jgi:hypothetical protein
VTTIAFELPPIHFLRELREEVLKHSHRRMPKWRFRLSADAVMQVQSKPTDCLSIVRFDGLAVKAIDGACSVMLDRIPTGEIWWRQKLDLHGYDNNKWFLSFIGCLWTYGAPLEGKQALQDAVLSAFRDGFFDRPTPKAMLSPQCLICGKGLTDPASMARGIGPECARTTSLTVPLRDVEALFASAETQSQASAPVASAPRLSTVINGPKGA